MAAADNGFLIDAAAYLGAAAIAVPIFRRLKLGSIIGYLAAGIALGPFGFGILRSSGEVFHVAELGVVLFLFIIGLELSFSRLWALRREIFGLGAAQVILTGAVIAAALLQFGMPFPTAAVAGFAFAISSTAFALQLLEERGELTSPHGQTSFSVLLFQDLAVIPLLAVIPFAASGEAVGAGPAELMIFAKMAGVIVALILIGRYALDPVLRIVAQSGSREAFGAAALFIVAATALAVSWAGLSMARGAFLAGALIAESAFRHQVETDIEPFRGLLLGLFFIGVGMQLDMALIAAQWVVVIGGAIALIVIKTALFYGLARIFREDHRTALRAAATLSQGGEFAFVVFSLGAAAGLFGSDFASISSAIVTISMAFTPLLASVADQVSRPKETGDSGADLEGPDGFSGEAIVVGFGRMGQIVSQILTNSGIAVTAIDNDPERIRTAERFGYKVYFGDGTRLDVLMTAGAVKADLAILLIDDTEKLHKTAERLREKYPKLKIISRAHDRLAELNLLDIDIDHIVRDVLESSILISRHSLEELGVGGNAIESMIEEFRKLDRERLFLQKAGGMEAGKDLIHQRYAAAKGIDRTS